MSSTDTIDALNHVLTILQRSFTQYLRYARPYIPPGMERVNDVLEQVAYGQDTLAKRVTQAVQESGGLPDSGEFPIEYTDSHDLSIDYLLEVAMDCQRQDIADLSRYVDTLRLAPSAQALASEALGMAKGNLERLEEIASGHTSTKFGNAKAVANDPPVNKDATGEFHRQEDRKKITEKPE